MRSLQDYRFIPGKTLCAHQIPTIHLPNALPNRISSPPIPCSPSRVASSRSPSPHKNRSRAQKIASFFNPPVTHLALTAFLSSPLPSLAAEAEQVSDKINVEAIVIAIDDFFNRNPFFVAGVTFIWLVVIPLTQEYLKKYKFISAIDAFRKLRDDPGSQLLDIRKKQSLAFMGSPNLKVLNKSAIQVEFREGDDEGFVNEVMRGFRDPGNTVVCVVDNFDGNSLEVAELLFKNGYKEAYAIKGGLRGKDGWQEIQEKLLPPPFHVYPRKKKKKSKPSSQPEETSLRVDEQNSDNGKAPTSASLNEDNRNTENGSVKPREAALEAILPPQRPLSPFPNYPDLKPPSSPTPSKP